MRIKTGVYLMGSFAQATATGLSQLPDHEVSHDPITRFLAGTDYTSRDLWSLVKATVCAVKAGDGMLIFDDTVEEQRRKHRCPLYWFNHFTLRIKLDLKVLQASFAQLPRLSA